MEKPSIIELSFHILEEEHGLENYLIFDHASSREYKVKGPQYLQINSE